MSHALKLPRSSTTSLPATKKESSRCHGCCRNNPRATWDSSSRRGPHHLQQESFRLFLRDEERFLHDLKRQSGAVIVIADSGAHLLDGAVVAGDHHLLALREGLGLFGELFWSEFEGQHYFPATSFTADQRYCTNRPSIFTSVRSSLP